MARLVLQLVGLLLVAAAGFGAAAEEAETTQPAGGLLRGSDRQAAPNQGRECPPGRCPRITCIPEAQMAQKKCGMASNMCPAGFCAAVGNCTSCSRRGLFAEDNDHNSPFFGFQSFPLPVPTAAAAAAATDDAPRRSAAGADKSTACPPNLCIRFTCVPAGGSIGYCGDSNPYCPKGQCPINGECVSCQ